MASLLASPAGGAAWAAAWAGGCAAGGAPPSPAPPPPMAAEPVPAFGAGAEDLLLCSQPTARVARSARDRRRVRIVAGTWRKPTPSAIPAGGRRPRAARAILWSMPGGDDASSPESSSRGSQPELRQSTTALSFVSVPFRRRFLVPGIVLGLAELIAIAYPLWIAFDLGDQIGRAACR